MTPVSSAHAAIVADIPSRISSHVSSAETFKGDFPSDLLSLLGCPHRSNPIGNFNGKLVIPDVNAQYMEAKGDALLVLLCHVTTRLGIYPDDAPAVLAGLYASGAWRRCLLQESTAYDLAAVLLCHLQTFAEDDALDAFTQMAVCRLLNEWLQPQVSWHKVPGVEEAAALLFGEVWCALRDPAAQAVYAGTMVHRERPPFAPGKCLVNSHVEAAPLPELGLVP